MKKKYYLILGILILIVVIAGLIRKAFFVPENPFPSYVPDIVMYDLSDQPVKPLVSENGTLFIFFNSDCLHCHESAEVFSDLKTELGEIQVYWVSSQQKPYIKLFAKKFRLTEQTTCQVLEDREGYMYTEFKIRTTPSILFYNKYGELSGSLEDSEELADFLRSLG